MTSFVLIPGAGGSAWYWHRVIPPVAGAGERFFPAGFQQRLAADRLGVAADLLPGGHLVALSQPGPRADYLLAAA